VRSFITKRKVIVAMNTGEVAALGDLNRSADRDSLRYDALVKAKTPLGITLGLHARMTSLLD